ncbi:hypothetical protein ACIPLA_10870 [Pseudomonas sp. NPDC086112]|uniref:hypothetical protein n=1 Tax=Pseudomonas sp. NPDC086112 TaxID=3364430 RepID=UPI003821589C
MELKNFFPQDDQGNALVGATCYLYLRGTESKANGLLKANGEILSNPFIAEENLVQFAAPNGLYDLRVIKDARDYRIRVQFNDVSESLQAAESAANRAEVARDATQLVAGVKNDIAHGLATTVSGQTFTVASAAGSQFLIVYKNVAGEAVEQSGYPSTSSLQAIARSTYPLTSKRFHRNAFRAPWVHMIHGKKVHAIRPDGVHEMNGLTLTKSESARHTGFSGLTLFYARDPAGTPHQVLSADPQGRLTFIPSPKLKALLGVGVNLIYPISDVRGAYAVSNIRKTDTHNIAAVQDRGGQIYDALQRRNGIHDTLVVSRAAPIELMPGAGQSNQGGAGTGAAAGAKLTSAQWPHSVLSLNGRFQMQGSNGLVDGATLTDLVPLYDPATPLGQYPITMQAFAWARQQCREGIAQPGVIGYTAWQGDTPANGFLPGTNNWTNLMTFTEKSVLCAALYQRTTECHYITRVQGEAGANWAADYATWADAVKPAIKARTGQLFDPKIALWQIAGVAPDNGVANPQLDAANNRADTELVGTLYPYPVSDVQHLTAEGRMMMGDVYSDFRLQLQRGSTWTPLQMQSVSRVGAVVTITLALPPGTFEVVKKTDWPPQVAQDGFVYRDSNGDTPISNIAYSANTIVLTLATVPTGNLAAVRYGMDAGSGVAGWYQLGGNVCAVSRTRSAYYEQGFNVPEFIRHYLARHSRLVA